MPRTSIPKLPQLLDRKIYKSGQTRGADDDEIFQNRVGRNSTALIRFDLWEESLHDLVLENPNYFEKGFIVLIAPEQYFSQKDPDEYLRSHGLSLADNCLIFFQQRADWEKYASNLKGMSVATSRTSPLGGHYVARIHATTAQDGNGERIAYGFTTTGMKGAGIRVYEYASKETIDACRLQLEALFWLCENSLEAVTDFGMPKTDALTRKRHILAKAKEAGLLDYSKLHKARMINDENITICPLCLEPLDAFGFFNRKSQAQGRETFDLTITELNLFHICELRPGEFNHKPYNLGWGHHLCNVVIGDEGIDNTVKWMHDVVERNVKYYSIRF